MHRILECNPRITDTPISVLCTGASEHSHLNHHIASTPTAEYGKSKAQAVTFSPSKEVHWAISKQSKLETLSPYML